jgi:hypothetical protein
VYGDVIFVPVAVGDSGTFKGAAEAAALAGVGRERAGGARVPHPRDGLCRGLADGRGDRRGGPGRRALPGDRREVPALDRLPPREPFPEAPAQRDRVRDPAAAAVSRHHDDDHARARRTANHRTTGARRGGGDPSSPAGPIGAQPGARSPSEPRTPELPVPHRIDAGRGRRFASPCRRPGPTTVRAKSWEGFMSQRPACRRRRMDVAPEALGPRGARRSVGVEPDVVRHARVLVAERHGHGRAARCSSGCRRPRSSP